MPTSLAILRNFFCLIIFSSAVLVLSFSAWQIHQVRQLVSIHLFEQAKRHTDGKNQQIIGDWLDDPWDSVSENFPIANLAIAIGAITILYELIMLFIRVGSSSEWYIVVDAVACPPLFIIWVGK